MGDGRAVDAAMTIGNSISMTGVEALRSASGTDGGWRLMSYGMFGCALTDSAQVPSGAAVGCSQRGDEALEAINRVKPDIVFVSGRLCGLSQDPTLQNTGQTKLGFLPGPRVIRT